MQVIAVASKVGVIKGLVNMFPTVKPPSYILGRQHCCKVASLADTRGEVETVVVTNNLRLSKNVTKAYC